MNSWYESLHVCYTMKLYGNKNYPLTNYSSNQLWVQLEYLKIKLETPAKLPSNKAINKWSSAKYAEFNKMKIKPKKTQIISDIHKTLLEIPIRGKSQLFQKFNNTPTLYLRTPLPISPPTSPSKNIVIHDSPTKTYSEAVNADPSSTPRFQTQNNSKGLTLLFNKLSRVQQSLSVSLAEFEFLRNSKRTSVDINARIKKAENLIFCLNQDRTDHLFHCLSTTRQLNLSFLRQNSHVLTRNAR